MLGLENLEEALETLGAILESRGVAAGLLIAGGSSLLLLGLIERPTADVDVVGLAGGGRYVKADPLPGPLRTYGSLEVHIPARSDLICFKLYAAMDRGPRSKHFADLKALEPTRHELIDAARWTRTHDPSEGFRSELAQALAALGVEVTDADRAEAS